MKLILVLTLWLFAATVFVWWYRGGTFELFEEDTQTIDLVVARYEEALDWLDQLDLSKFRRVIVYNKGSDLELGEEEYEVIPLENVGRCDHTYLYHIIHNQGQLAHTTIFLPGSCDMDYKWPNALRTVNFAIETRRSVFVGQPRTDVLTDEYAFMLDEWKASYDKNLTINGESQLLPCPERPFGKWFDANFGKMHIDTVVYFGIFAVSRADIEHRSLESYKTLITYLDHHSNPEAGHYFERAWLAVFDPVRRDCIYHE